MTFSRKFVLGRKPILTCIGCLGLGVVCTLAFLILMILLQSNNGSKYFKVLGSLKKDDYGSDNIIDLKDGRLLISQNYFYKIKEKKLIKVKGERTCNWSYPKMLLMPNKQVLIYDGLVAPPEDKCSNAAAEVLDLKTETFSPIFQRDAVLFKPQGITLSDGRVFLIGGYVDHRKDTTGNRVFLYDPKRKHFSVVGHLLVPRREHNVLLLPDDNILIVGGNYAKAVPIGETEDERKKRIVTLAERFNTKTYRSEAVTNLKFTRNYPPSLVLLNDEKVVVIGSIGVEYVGYDDHSTLNNAYSWKEPVEIIDLKNKTSRISGVIPVKKSMPAAFLLPNEKVIIIGGGLRASRKTTEKSTKSVYIYDPATGLVKLIDILPEEFSGERSVITKNSDIFLIGYDRIQKFSYKEYTKKRRGL